MGGLGGDGGDTAIHGCPHAQNSTGAGLRTRQGFSPRSPIDEDPPGPHGAEGMGQRRQLVDSGRTGQLDKSIAERPENPHRPSGVITSVTPSTWRVVSHRGSIPRAVANNVPSGTPDFRLLPCPVTTSVRSPSRPTEVMASTSPDSSSMSRHMAVVLPAFLHRPMIVMVGASPTRGRAAASWQSLLVASIGFQYLHYRGPSSEMSMPACRAFSNTSGGRLPLQVRPPMYFFSQHEHAHIRKDAVLSLRPAAYAFRPPISLRGLTFPPTKYIIVRTGGGFGRHIS